MGIINNSYVMLCSFYHRVNESLNELNPSIYTWQMSGGVLQDSTLQFLLTDANSISGTSNSHSTLKCTRCLHFPPFFTGSLAAEWSVVHWSSTSSQKIWLCLKMGSKPPMKASHFSKRDNDHYITIGFFGVHYPFSVTNPYHLPLAYLAGFGTCSSTWPLQPMGKPPGTSDGCSQPSRGSSSTTTAQALVVVFKLTASSSFCRWRRWNPGFTLWWTNIAMENHHFWWENPL